MSFRKNEIVIREEAPVKGIYFLTSGTVKVQKKWGAGKELILRFAQKGDILGHRGLGPDTNYPISATALESTSACFIDLDFFQTSLRINQPLMFGLLQFFAAELQESERKMRDLAHQSVKGRLTTALLMMQEKFGRDPEGYLRFKLSRQDMASVVGAAYETVFRVINELAEEGILGVDGKKLRIQDPERLKRYAKT